MLEEALMLRQNGRFEELNDLVPYARMVGLETEFQDGRMLTVLRKNEDNVGNVALMAVHGGVIGALMEHAASLHLLWELKCSRVPKILNVSIDYLRPALMKDTFASGIVIKQGRRVANVRVHAWQEAEDKPVAAAHAHFLIA